MLILVSTVLIFCSILLTFKMVVYKLKNVQYVFLRKDKISFFDGGFGMPDFASIKSNWLGSFRTEIIALSILGRPVVIYLAA